MNKMIWMAVFLTGCASMGDVVKEHDAGGGITRLYDVEAKEAWKLAHAVLRWNRASIIEDRPEENAMRTSTDAEFGRAGSFVGVWLEPVGYHTRVTIVSRRKQATFLQGLDEETFQRDFERAVSIVHAGGKVPEERP